MRVSKEFRVGLLVVLGVLLIYVLVNILKGETLFGSQREFYAEFDNTSGLQASNEVLMNGVKVGQVISIDLHSEKINKVLVKFSIQREDLQIPNTSCVWFISSDILGTKALEIRMDTIPRPSVEYYQNGDTMCSSSALTIEDQISQEILPLKVKVEELIGTVEAIVNTVQTFWDTSAAQTIDESLYEVRDAIARFGELANTLSILVETQTHVISDVLGNINVITTSLSQKTDKMSSILDNFAELSDSLKNADINGVIDSARTAMSEITMVLNKVNSGEGTIGKLLHTDELHNQLTKTMVSLQNLLDDMEANPNKYVHFSLLGRKVKGFSTTKEKIEILDNMLDSLQMRQISQ